MVSGHAHGGAVWPQQPQRVRHGALGEHRRIVARAGRRVDQRLGVWRAREQLGGVACLRTWHKCVRRSP